MASYREYHLAIDDNQAIKKASSLLPPSSIFRTQDLVLDMIDQGILTLQEADDLIEVWATKHRFKLNLKSFADLMTMS